MSFSVSAPNPSDQCSRWIAKKRDLLIDASRRNRLLYFKTSETKTLQIIEPSLQEIYDWLIIREKAFEFPALEEDFFDYLLDEEENDPNGEKPRSNVNRVRNENELYTKQPFKRQVRTLNTLRKESTLTMEEKGINTLFLAVGFIEWIDPVFNEAVLSPILLLPVKLEQKGLKTVHSLKKSEDEIEINPVLVYKFQNEFNLRFPEYSDEDSLNLEEYFEEIETYLRQNGKSWTVLRELHLGPFSFPSMPIYRDAAWEIAAQNPIVRRLSGEMVDLPNGLDTVQASDLDKLVKPEKAFQVLDGDSSQQEAIELAKLGISFVIQGPPGTGKSQTIVNIIAETLAANKRVLFVSEKMAALNVVFERLKKQGLGSYCLPLHSTHTRRDAVITELGRILSKKPSGQRYLPPNFERLVQTREILNNVVVELHKLRSPLQKSIYDVHGELAKLFAAQDAIFDFHNPSRVSPSEYANIGDLVKQLSHYHETLARYQTHPWRGAKAEIFSLQLQTDIKVRFGELSSQLDELHSILVALSQRLNLAPLIGLNEFKRLLTLTKLVAESPLPPAEWFRPDYRTILIVDAGIHKQGFDDYRDRRQNLQVFYDKKIYSLPHADLLEKLKTRLEFLSKELRQSPSEPADKLIQDRVALFGWLSGAISHLKEIELTSNSLSHLCGLTTPARLQEVTDLISTAGLVAKNPKPQNEWFSKPALNNLKLKATEAQKQFEKYFNSRKYLRGRYQEKFLEVDYSELQNQLNGKFASPFRLLYRMYRTEKRKVSDQLLTPSKLTYEMFLHDVTQSNYHRESKKWIDDNQQNHAKEFRRHHAGLDTDWQYVLNSIDVCRKLFDHFGEETLQADLKSALLQTRPPIQEIESLTASLTNSQMELDQNLSNLNQILRLENLPFAPIGLQSCDVDKLMLYLQSLLQNCTEFFDAHDEAKGCRKAIETNDNSNMFLFANLIKDVLEAESLVEVEATINLNSEKLRVQFGHLFNGIETKWESILNALGWTGQILEWFAPGVPSERFIIAVCDKSELSQIKTLDFKSRQLLDSLKNSLSYLYTLFSETTEIWEGKTFEDAPIDCFSSWVQERSVALRDLEEWLRFKAHGKRCVEFGLGSFVEAIQSNCPDADRIASVFENRFWRLWLDEINLSVPLIATLDSRNHNNFIQEFRREDKRQFEIAQNRLNRQLCESIFRIVAAAQGGEIQILKRQMEMKRRHKPLRKLFQEIPNLLVALKPCLMMNPLSVAQLLKAEPGLFDLVIFDEASQILSEDAIGAIVRGKQVIVVGDKKQLPPTKIGAINLVGESDDEDEQLDVDAFESVLDEMTATGIPQRRLLWHYRSRREELIAFSNSHFYEKELVTFPSPFSGEGGDKAVEFIHVPNGVYYRGLKVKGKGTNPIEAVRVAELVFEHFKTSPHLSLGVISFSGTQMAAIDREVTRLRMNHPDFEEHFLRDKEEYFFIKNLEHVQGDERDVIIFSVGYARDQNGKIGYTLGPLTQTGGERRLNVAITRAKYQVKLVSSILPSEFDETRVTKDGGKRLKNYLQFAVSGSSTLPEIITQISDDNSDFIFEEQVAMALEGEGYHLHRRIGKSSCRIDIAVIHPEKPGQYVLGIECDGNSYLQANTARDRDRLRTEVLEGLSWKLLRVWSRDWVYHREIELNRILEAVKSIVEGKSSMNSDSDDAIKPDGEVDIADIPYLKDDVELEDTENRDGTPQIIHSSGPQNYYQRYPEMQRGDSSEFETLARKNNRNHLNHLIEIVDIEGPVHFDSVFRAIIHSYGLIKVTDKVHVILTKYAKAAVTQGLIETRGDFYWKKGQTEIPFRVPKPDSPDSKRTIEHIPLEEIADCAFDCAERGFSVPKSELIRSVAKLFDIIRMTDNIQNRIFEGITYGLVSGRLIESNGYFSAIR